MEAVGETNLEALGRRGSRSGAAPRRCPALAGGGDVPRRWRVGADLLSLIEVRDGVRGGKPSFVGTRVTVYDVLEYLAGGMTTAEIVWRLP